MYRLVINAGFKSGFESAYAVEGFTPARVFLSGDGKYLTLGSNDKRCILMKRE